MNHQTHRYSSWLHRILHDIAWPSFACLDCTATGAGCYCSYHNAVAPGVGPTKWHLFWRWIWEYRA